MYWTVELCELSVFEIRAEATCFMHNLSTDASSGHHKCDPCRRGQRAHECISATTLGRRLPRMHAQNGKTIHPARPLQGLGGQVDPKLTLRAWGAMGPGAQAASLRANPRRIRGSVPELPRVATRAGTETNQAHEEGANTEAQQLRTVLGSFATTKPV